MKIIEYVMKCFLSLIEEMKNIENSGMKSFRSYCISYMICKRYGIDVTNFDFSKLPSKISNIKEPKEVRAEIEKIRKNYEDINSRISDYFVKNNKEKNKSNPER